MQTFAVSNDIVDINSKYKSEILLFYHFLNMKKIYIVSNIEFALVTFFENFLLFSKMPLSNILYR